MINNDTSLIDETAMGISKEYFAKVQLNYSYELPRGEKKMPSLTSGSRRIHFFTNLNPKASAILGIEGERTVTSLQGRRSYPVHCLQGAERGGRHHQGQQDLHTGQPEQLLDPDRGEGLQEYQE